MNREIYYQNCVNCRGWMDVRLIEFHETMLKANQRCPICKKDREDNWTHWIRLPNRLQGQLLSVDEREIDAG